MASITTRSVTENGLKKEMNIEEFSRYASALDILLTDKTKRDQARRRFKKGYDFSEKQVFALIHKQKAGRKKGGAVSDVPNAPDITQEAEPDAVNTCQISQKETIRDLAEPITLSGTASNASAGLSRLTRLRREMKALRASEKIISTTFIPNTTRSANKIQKERTPDLQALADIMIMLCIRPAKIKDLRISNGGSAISSRQLRDPGKPRVLWFNTFLKKDEFIPKPYEPLLPSSLRKIGSVFASVVHRPKNQSKANTYRSKALRHSPDNHTFPSDRYGIVNYRKRGQPYDQAEAIKIFDEK
ncbi:hypothetical protein C1646_771990 [Rhizophagus diaphanus]|nr:hypothetical protein C1646_771990 [Rhizophagus diaphanus] [Rhizophagus sp. MUCL 43196]